MSRKSRSVPARFSSTRSTTRPPRCTRRRCSRSWSRISRAFPTSSRVRRACRALGITAPVTSPTFTIGHRYGGEQDVSHLDLYRFEGLSAAEWGDLEPYFEDAIAFVEWPDAGRDALPAARVEIQLEHA